MTATTDVKAIWELFAEKSPLEPISGSNNQHPIQVRQNYGVIDADPDLTKRVLRELQAITEPRHPKFYMGYHGHSNMVAKLAFTQDVGHGEATRVWYRPPDSPTGDIFYLQAKFAQAVADNEDMGNFQLAAYVDEKILGTKKEIILADQHVETGGAALVLVRKLRDLGHEINHAVFLVEMANKGGREILQQEGVQVFSLATYSLKNGFGPGITPADVDRAQNALQIGAVSRVVPVDKANRWQQPRLPVRGAHSFRNSGALMHLIA